MRALGMTFVGLALCLPLAVPAHAENFSFDDLKSMVGDNSRDVSVAGVVKAVDSPGGTFTVTVEKKGDVQFRVSPQTRFESEMLGGVIGREVGAGLEGLKRGDSVKVRYLTLPPEKPVAAEVEIAH